MVFNGQFTAKSLKNILLAVSLFENNLQNEQQKPSLQFASIQIRFIQSLKSANGSNADFYILYTERKSLL